MSKPYHDPYDWFENPPNTPFNRAMERKPGPQAPWEEVLPQAWVEAVKESPLYGALSKYFNRRSFDDYAREKMRGMEGNDPISRIAAGKGTVASEYPEPTALERWFGKSDAHAQLGTGLNVLANFIGPAAPKLPPALRPTGIRGLLPPAVAAGAHMTEQQQEPAQ